MEGNTEHLLKAYGAAGLVTVLLLLLLGVAIAQGEYVVASIVPLALAAGLLISWHTKRRLLLLFRDSTPDRACAFYHSKMRLLPNGPALIAYSSAIACAYYGEFAAAREELSVVPGWEGLPPLYQGLRQHALAVVALLEDKDYALARRLSLESIELCRVSVRFPGSQQSRATLEATVAVCDLLSGQGDERTVVTLERAARTLPGVVPALPAWALASYYHRKGQPEASLPFQAIVRGLVPKCWPLNRYA
jgi:hypothetical protein